MGSARNMHDRGYVRVHVPGHHRANANGYVYEHLLVAEAALGRPLCEPHQVHHVSPPRSDNRGCNLVICEDQAYHMLIERRQKALDECGHADWARCEYCGEYSPPEEMWTHPERPRRSHHPECNARVQRERRRRQREERATAWRARRVA